MQSSHPKIVYNEESIDLRGNFEPALNNRRNQIDDQEALWRQYNLERKTRNNKNEVVNTALKKLAKSYHSSYDKPLSRVREHSFNNPCIKRFSAVQDASSLKSKSELATFLKKDSSNRKAMYPSSPTIQSTHEKGDSWSRIEPYKNKFTMTKSEAAKDGKKLVRGESIEKLINKFLTEKPSLGTSEQRKNPVWKDYRLVDKYSLLKVPWRRSYTLPVYSSQPSVILKEEFCKKLKDYSDKNTYLYDDGSDIDSTFCKEPRPMQQTFGFVFQSEMLTLLNISAYLCALLVLSLIVWFVSGNKLLYKLIVSEPPEDPVKKYIKYIGGSIIYTISNIIRIIGSIFSIPTQQVYQPAAIENSWPP